MRRGCERSLRPQVAAELPRRQRERCTAPADAGGVLVGEHLLPRLARRGLCGVSGRTGFALHDSEW